MVRRTRTNTGALLGDPGVSSATSPSRDRANTGLAQVKAQESVPQAQKEPRFHSVIKKTSLINVSNNDLIWTRRQEDEGIDKTAWVSIAGSGKTFDLALFIYKSY